MVLWQLNKLLGLLWVTHLARIWFLQVNFDRLLKVDLLLGNSPGRPHHVLLVVDKGTLFILQLLLSQFEFLFDLNFDIRIQLIHLTIPWIQRVHLWFILFVFHSPNGFLDILFSLFQVVLVFYLLECTRLGWFGLIVARFAACLALFESLERLDLFGISQIWWKHRDWWCHWVLASYVRVLASLSKRVLWHSSHETSLHCRLLWSCWPFWYTLRKTRNCWIGIVCHTKLLSLAIWGSFQTFANICKLIFILILRGWVLLLHKLLE